MRSRAISRRGSRCCRPKPTASPIPRRCIRHSGGAGGTIPNSRRTKMRTEMAVRLSLCAPALALLLSACSPGDAGQAPPPPAPVPKNVTLTPDQRQHITLYTVAPMNYRRTIETTGAVDFDGDQSTSVLAPISGPVSRLLVSIGQRVKKGDPLALVESPDFATAVS